MKYMVLCSVLSTGTGAHHNGSIIDGSEIHPDAINGLLMRKCIEPFAFTDAELVGLSLADIRDYAATLGIVTGARSKKDDIITAIQQARVPQTVILSPGPTDDQLRQQAMALGIDPSGIERDSLIGMITTELARLKTEADDAAQAKADSIAEEQAQAAAAQAQADTAQSQPRQPKAQTATQTVQTTEASEEEQAAMSELQAFADDALAERAKANGIDPDGLPRKEIIGAIYGAELEAKAQAAATDK
jgi:hypothetical protein